jgi:hypothetical protein
MAAGVPFPPLRCLQRAPACRALLRSAFPPLRAPPAIAHPYPPPPPPPCARRPPGLGDRHPSNLMLDRYSGKLLHIDFGDCFEASMHRDKFPEKVGRGRDGTGRDGTGRAGAGASAALPLKRPRPLALAARRRAVGCSARGGDLAPPQTRPAPPHPTPRCPSA